MITHLQMISIFVTDIERSLAFYVEKLGFVKTYEYDDGVGDRMVWVVPRRQESNQLTTRIALSQVAADDARVGNLRGVVFSAENIQSTYNALKSQGVQFTLDLIRHPYGDGDGDQEARFVDPDGNEFLLHT